LGWKPRGIPNPIGVVVDQLPKDQRPWVRAKLRAAWAEENYPRALASLKALARALEHQHPAAAASLREGMEETRKADVAGT